MNRLFLSMMIFLVSCASAVKVSEQSLAEIRGSKGIILVVGEERNELGQAQIGDGTYSTGLAGAFAQDAIHSEVNKKLIKFCSEFKAIDLARNIAKPLLEEKINHKLDIYPNYVVFNKVKKEESKEIDPKKVSHIVGKDYAYAVIVKFSRYGIFRPVKIIAYRPFGVAEGGIELVSLKDQIVSGKSRPKIISQNKVEVGWKDVENYNTLREKVKESYSNVMTKAIEQTFSL